MKIDVADKYVVPLLAVELEMLEQRAAVAALGGDPGMIAGELFSQVIELEVCVRGGRRRRAVENQLLKIAALALLSAGQVGTTRGRPRPAADAPACACAHADRRSASLPPVGTTCLPADRQAGGRPRPDARSASLPKKGTP